MKKLTKKVVLGLALIGFLMVPMFALTIIGAEAAVVRCGGAFGAGDICNTGAFIDANGVNMAGNSCTTYFDDDSDYSGNVSCIAADCTVDSTSCGVAIPVGQWGDTRSPENVPTDIKGAIMNVTNWILGFVAIIATLIVIYGGVLYLTAAGNEESVEKAKKTISYGIIGIVICGLAYAIVIVVSTVILTA